MTNDPHTRAKALIAAILDHATDRWRCLSHDCGDDRLQAVLTYADEIRQDLTTERDRLRAALEQVLPYAEAIEDEGPPGEGWRSKPLMDILERARAALSPEDR